MPTRQRVRWIGLLLLIVLFASFPAAHSQPPTASGERGGQATVEERVVIQREAMRLMDPKRYQVALVLEPVRKVTIAAPIAGVVRSMLRKPGDTVTSGTTAVRLDDTEQTLLVEQSQANLKVAEIELRRAKKQPDTDLIELAEAQHDSAKAAHELAKFHLEQTDIRVPFAGEVFRTHVIEGQVVGVGAPLCEFGDPTQLRVEIPVDRKSVKAKQSINLTIEDTTVEGTVESVLPLAAKFGPLRDLVKSLASATVIINNESGRLRPGQVVDVAIIPQQFVTQIPNRSLSNVADGGRKVQVVRSGVIRDVHVQLLGQVGTDLSYVSGPFAPGDELIVSASLELADGTQVRPANVAAKPEPRSAGRNSGSNPTKRGVGF
jgi:multidrug efflux pump subunit AcrA (membrane-fusion protein)